MKKLGRAEGLPIAGENGRVYCVQITGQARQRTAGLIFLLSYIALLFAATFLFVLLLANVAAVPIA